MVLNKNKITADMLLEFFDNADGPINSYLIEMTGWAFLLNHTKFCFLPIERYHIKGGLMSETVAKHFTNPRRHEFYAYGIDEVRKRMLADKQG